jgi:hypothetical protein
MAVAIATISRRVPTCSKHPASHVRFDGYWRCRWSDAHRRPRYRCVPAPGDIGHALSLEIAVRQPTDTHPDAGRACPNCEHIYERHEGVRTGRGFVFGIQEIARVLLRVGEGMSLRDASRDERVAVLRVNRRAPDKPRFKSIRPGATSRQANLAVNYLDAYAPAIIDALHPREWPEVVVLDSTSLKTSGFRPPTKAEIEKGADPDEEKEAGDLKAGTIMIAMDPTGPATKPCLIQAQGGKDAESWKDFLGSLEGSPKWVVADLDPAIARAVRETWPKAILYHSRHHLAERMRKCADEDGVPRRIRLEEPVELSRPMPWTGATVKRWGEHPLHEALGEAQRGPEKWAEFLAAIEEHVPADKLALRSWIATNEALIERQWRIARIHGRVPLSTGALEGKVTEWLGQLRKRGGRWQNLRRLNLVLALITLRGRGEAREARYAKLIRAHFEARGNRSHLAAENTLPIVDGRQMSWWRTWHDRGEASLPRLVREAESRRKKRDNDDHVARTRERLEQRYAEEAGLRAELGLPAQPKGRPKNPRKQARQSLKGRYLREFEELMLEWDWDRNGDLDPDSLRAGTKERVIWRCLLDANHVWESRVSARAYGQSFCPFHMRTRVHPADSLAAHFPWLALEWHPTKNSLRPDQVTHASSHEAVWMCDLGHEWPAVVYSRTLSKTGCPDCAALAHPAKMKAAAKKRRQNVDQHAEAQIRSVIPLEELAAAGEL